MTATNFPGGHEHGQGRGCALEETNPENQVQISGKLLISMLVQTSFLKIDQLPRVFAIHLPHMSYGLSVPPKFICWIPKA